jgi:hypothetical protein
VAYGDALIVCQCFILLCLIINSIHTKVKLLFISIHQFTFLMNIYSCTFIIDNTKTTFVSLLIYNMKKRKKELFTWKENQIVVKRIN